MENKTIGLLGGIGIILLFLGGISGGIGNLVGIVLVLIAYYHLGEKYDKKIWNKKLASIIVFFVGIFLALVISIPFLIKEIYLGLIISGLILFISLIMSGKLVYEANKITSRKVKIKEFETGGLLIFVGAITTVFLIGIIISFIGYIFLAIAFFKLNQFKN